MRTSSHIAPGTGFMDFGRRYSIENLISSFLEKARNSNEMKLNARAAPKPTLLQGFGAYLRDENPRRPKRKGPIEF